MNKADNMIETGGSSMDSEDNIGYDEEEGESVEEEEGDDQSE